MRSEREALALLFEGEANRVIGEHQLNRESSRSHCVFTLTLELDRGGSGGVTSSAISLVDLAGSERVSKTGSAGAVLREAGHINRSLAILEQVVLAAGERGREHVPYRSSRLTHVLRDSIGGNARAVLVANVWGDAGQLGETLSTCRFAARMARVACEVTRNVAAPRGGGGGGGARVRQLEREVAELLEELAMHDLWAAHRRRRRGSDAAGAAADAAAAPLAAAASVDDARGRYAAYGPERRRELKEQVQRFLLDGSDDGSGMQNGEYSSHGAGDSSGGGGADGVAALEICSVRRLREVLLACRALYQEALRPNAAAPAGAAAAPALATPAAFAREQGGSSGGGGGGHSASGLPAASWGASGASSIPEQQQQRHWVGDDDEDASQAARQSGGVGVAPEHARPGSQGDGAAWQQQQQQQQQQGRQRGSFDNEQPAAGASGASLAPSGYSTPGPARASAIGEVGASSSDGGGLEDAVAALLEEFRAGPGAAKAQLLVANRAKTRAAKRAARDAALTLNALKAEIDAAAAAAGAARAERLARAGGDAAAAGLAAPEELEALARCRDLKAAYRDAHGGLQLARSEAGYAAGLVEACKRELLAEFEVWRAARCGGGGGGGVGSSGGRAAPGAEGFASRAPSAGSSMLLGGLPTPGSSVPWTPVDGRSGSGTPVTVGSVAASAQAAGALPASRGWASAGFAGGSRGSSSGGNGGGVPLASLVAAAAAEAEAAGDAGAAAYYSAQSAAWRDGHGGGGSGGGGCGGGARVGAMKQHRHERGTFSSLPRGSSILEARR